MNVEASKQARETNTSDPKKASAARASSPGKQGIREQVRSTVGFEAQSALLKPATAPTTNVADSKAKADPKPDSKPVNWSELVRRNFHRIDKNHDGFLSRREVNEALSNASFTGADAAAVATLHKFTSDLEELSNDESGDENDGLTMNDLIAYEQGNREKKLKGDLASVEAIQSKGVQKIRATKRKLFPNGVPHLWALKQGAIGDCYFLAALGSFIARDPQALVRMIDENRQGDKVVSYTVKFPNQKFGSVTVSQPTDGEIARYSSALEDGLWLVVMEKAYAVARSKQKTPDVEEEIGEGGQLKTGMSPFTTAGMDGDYLLGTLKTTTRDKLNAAFGTRGRRRLVTASIQSDNEHGLPKHHAYSVIDWDGKFVTIRNPWGRNPKGKKELQGVSEKDPGQFRMSLDEFDKVFSEIVYQE